MYGQSSQASGTKRGNRRPWGLPASLALLGASVVGAADAGAATTLVGRSKSAGEANHEQVLEHRFGGDFRQEGNDFTNGSVTVTRVDDSADRSFSGNIKRAQVIGAFARKQQSFGVYDSQGNYTELVSVTGRGFDVSGSAESMGAALAAASTADAGSGGGQVTFGRAGGKPDFASDPTMNQGGRDHLVTYSVSGSGVDGGTMLLFWEDATGRRADFDFNDLVVEITAEPLLIPLPAAAWSGLSGLAALGLMAGYRRVRRARTA